MKTSNILNLVLQRMAEGYEAQAPHYEEMYKLALEQEKVLQQDEVDADLLVEIINKRQEIIDVIDQESKGMAPLKAEVCQTLEIEQFNLNKIKEKVSGEGVQRLDQAVVGLSRLLQKIKALDQANEEVLRKRIHETKDKLTEVQNSKKANKAYTAKVNTQEGVFIDFSK